MDDHAAGVPSTGGRRGAGEGDGGADAVGAEGRAEGDAWVEVLTDEDVAAGKRGGKGRLVTPLRVVRSLDSIDLGTSRER